VARRDHAAAVRRGPPGLTGGRPKLPATSPSLTIDFPSNFYFLAEGKGLLHGWSDPNEPEGFNVRWLPR
jgi:hypothetical protein